MAHELFPLHDLQDFLLIVINSLTMSSHQCREASLDFCWGIRCQIIMLGSLNPLFMRKETPNFIA